MAYSTDMMRVGVLGALGRMGREVCRTVTDSEDFELVAAIDPSGRDGNVDGVATSVSIDDMARARAEVVVDFTHPDVAEANIDWCIDRGVHVVVGTSGFNGDKLDRLGDRLAGTNVNVIVVPNFAIGGVLMMHFAEQAAMHMQAAEIIELHHDRKADAPSGTAVSTAEAIMRGRGAVGAVFAPSESIEHYAGARGARVGDVAVHSVRLPGVVAHQEVIFGAQGQTLTIRHDSYDRSSFMPGVLLALGHVRSRPGLTVGLEPLLGLD